MHHHVPIDILPPRTRNVRVLYQDAIWFLEVIKGREFDRMAGITRIPIHCMGHDEDIEVPVSALPVFFDYSHVLGIIDTCSPRVWVVVGFREREFKTSRNIGLI